MQRHRMFFCAVAYINYKRTEMVEAWDEYLLGHIMAGPSRLRPGRVGFVVVKVAPK